MNQICHSVFFFTEFVNFVHVFRFRNFGVYLFNCVNLFCSYKRRNLKWPHSLIEFHDSTITVVCCSCINHYQTSKPVIGWAPYLFVILWFSVWRCAVFLHRELVNPETSKCWSQIPFTFHNSGVIVCWCLALEIAKSWTSKPRSVRPTFHSLFAIRELLCVGVWAFEIMKSWTPKPRSAGPTFFLHFAIRQTTWSFVFCIRHL